VSTELGEDQRWKRRGRRRVRWNFWVLGGKQLVSG